MKKRNLKLGGLKLSVNAEQKSAFSSHIVSVLDHNDLVILDQSKQKNLLEAVSECLFLSPTYSGEMLKQCFGYLRKNIDKEDLFKNLKFVQDQENFLEDYRNNPYSSIFDAVSIFNFPFSTGVLCLASFPP
jgi:hypothetical protein